MMSRMNTYPVHHVYPVIFIFLAGMAAKSAAPTEATFLLLMIYLPPRAQRTQRMEKFRGLLKIDPLIKPQISL
ncbi:MAG: hypothetical protein K940chlam7_00933, partial [Chlamydiae bacterium]|nr:hypothetical protein [Chlamydiota bacterium]